MLWCGPAGAGVLGTTGTGIRGLQRQEPGRDGDPEVDRDGHPGRLLHAERGKQPVSGGYCACHGSGGVETLEKPGLVAERTRPRRKALDENGERSPHHEGGNEDQQAANGESRQVEKEEVLFENAIEPGVERCRGGEQEWEEKSEESDSRLEQGVEPNQAPGSPIDESTQQVTARSEPGHERAEDRTSRQEGVALDQDERPRPDDLVVEA